MGSGMRATLEQLNPKIRAQAEAQLRIQGTVRGNSTAEPGDPKRRNKYGNRVTVFEGEKFHSEKEVRRWRDLKLLEKAGEVQDLKRQVAFELAVQQGSCKYEICVYIADFVYRNKDGARVVEDVKGYTRGLAYRLFLIKKKLMQALLRIEVMEI
jgi:hypothetical protein